MNKVLSIRPNSARAHMARGCVQIFTNRAAQGIREFEHALALDPNLADAHAAIGLAKFYMGRAAETEGHILEALRLSPRDVFAYRWMCFVGVAKLQLGADAEAVGWLRRSIEANRNFPLAHFSLAAALALPGALDEARAAAKAGLALNSGFTIRRLLAANKATIRFTLLGCERFCEGMRLAGRAGGVMVRIDTAGVESRPGRHKTRCPVLPRNRQRQMSRRCSQRHRGADHSRL